MTVQAVIQLLQQNVSGFPLARNDKLLMKKLPDPSIS